MRRLRTIVFDPVSFTVDRIRDENEYGGVRINGNATVDKAMASRFGNIPGVVSGPI
ncbi:hypothetical protein [Bradyrhizobium sp. Gha]|uniref:hypothetical protein n=1 Tax=Bradyrhizobium sp. Gha TaxID=1855318 RepID=UPI0008E24150|nr:hypothetical protein [Bradyrhizobium sp. Gha]SFJ45921.1 hypothetical protein SAMN05216525_125121 [Bradyrhizobium sp. Gha]